MILFTAHCHGEVKSVKRTLYKEEIKALPEECCTFVSNKLAKILHLVRRLNSTIIYSEFLGDAKKILIFSVLPCGRRRERYMQSKLYNNNNFHYYLSAY